MPDIAKKCIVVGIIKDLYEQGLLTEDEMKVAIIEIDKDYENKLIHTVVGLVNATKKLKDERLSFSRQTNKDSLYKKICEILSMFLF